MAASAPTNVDLTHTFMVYSSEGLYLLTANKYMKVASATLLFLEIISTLPDEVNQIVDFTTIFDFTGDLQVVHVHLA
ncbi:hypothetical protein GSI_10535 [Ganoderma sinense ZZ0214-1]|uniref:Uncharacterized protein n=1 Tax=Ganoderma sinense ZZ0214-1 TaxID=1077348 RepID=A0A2G8S0X0_9APHY|nr:hypothetical protein GSI_10535 [Ganoderma sinense ZZ0214-1]